MNYTPDNLPTRDLALLCTNSAKLGAEVARKYFLTTYTVSTKTDTSIVTAADIAAERAIREFLKSTIGAIGFEGEETGLEVGGDLLWRVDPIDGTDNFAIGIPIFSTTVALVSPHECLCGAIVSPMTNQVFSVDQVAGAFLNEAPLTLRASPVARHTRVAFIPDYFSKRTTFVRSILDDLRSSVFRVIDSWAPALDWCALAAGHIDAILQISSTPPTPNAGYLLAEKTGVRTLRHTITTATHQDLYVLIASTTTDGGTEIEKLLENAKGRL